MEETETYKKIDEIFDKIKSNNVAGKDMCRSIIDCYVETKDPIQKSFLASLMYELDQGNNLKSFESMGKFLNDFASDNKILLTDKEMEDAINLIVCELAICRNKPEIDNKVRSAMSLLIDKYPDAKKNFHPKKFNKFTSEFLEALKAFAYNDIFDQLEIEGFIESFKVYYNLLALTIDEYIAGVIMKIKYPAELDGLLHSNQ